MSNLGSVNLNPGFRFGVTSTTASGGLNISNNIRDFNWDDATRDLVENTVSGDGSNRSFKLGKRSITASGTVIFDGHSSSTSTPYGGMEHYADTNVQFSFVYVQDQLAVRSTSNPQWSGTGVMPGFAKVPQGSLGDLLQHSFQIQVNGDVTMDTSSTTT